MRKNVVDPCMIESMLADVRLNPDYSDFKYDPSMGLICGPYKGDSYTPELSKSEAVIGVQQPISRFAQHHKLLLEKNPLGKWDVKKRLFIVES